MIKKTAFLFLVILIFLKSQGQENSNRLGLVFGNPYVIGLDYEHVIKRTGNRIGFVVDLSIIPINQTNSKMDLFNLSIGGNYYILKEYKGLYTGISLSYLNYESTNKNQMILNESTEDFYSDGEINEKLESFNLNPKIGYKWILGKFCIAPDIGFFITKTLDFTKTEKSDQNNYLKQEDLNPNKLIGSMSFSLAFGFMF
jgi:hypothetical protein